ncbi:HEAT repeat domain-containing protein [Bacillus sp. J33]|uniref:HEAT repeat domain-containing protein n=1 Tax=Bacillus sp. J33 TaxID=935836 RepID=UPI00047B1106|nr:HEAT repeat domain-containing protein [Bacillus sp. J33]
MEMIGVTIGVLSVFILAMLVILLSLAVYISRQYERKRRLIVQKNACLNKILPIWHDYLVKDQEADLTELAPASKIEFEVTERILLSYVKNFSNREIQAKVKEFANQFLKDYYSAFLKSKKWSLRMNAFYRIADFQMDSLLDVCRMQEEKGCSREELQQIYKIYALLDIENLAAKLRTEQESLGESGYRSLFNILSENDLKQIVTLFEEFPQKCKLAILDTLGYQRLTDYMPLFERQLLSRDQEMRIRSLKAIYETGWVVSPAQFLHFVESPIWEERLLVTKLLGRLPLEETYPYLKQLLEDPSWWVRAEAAKTIGKMKTGKEKLLEFINHTSDQYAREMANEILKKGM